MEALNLLRLLKPEKYEYKDKLAKGSSKVFGFIAQDIKQIMPECVNTRSEFIPNILETASVRDTNFITFTRFDTSNLVNDTSVLRILSIDNVYHDVNIVGIIDNKTIQVTEDLSSYTGSVDEEGNAITKTEISTISSEEYETLDNRDGYIPTKDNTYVRETSINVGMSIVVIGEKVDDFPGS